MGEFIATYADYNGEKSTVTVPTVDLTAGNIAATLTLMQNFHAAVEGIALGEPQMYRRVVSVSPQPGGNASSPAAQRELKWLVRYRDATTGKKGRMEIPCADVTLLDEANRGFMDLESVAGQAFGTAFEALVLGPDGNAATLDSVQLVGRNI